MRYQIDVAHKTCLVLPNALITGSFNRKLANIVPENIHKIVESQQASGCFLEKYIEPVDDSHRIVEELVEDLGLIW